MSNARQEMLDKVISRAKLGVKSNDGVEDNGNTCLYRTKDGNRCFVGELILDEKYSPHIENEEIGKDVIEMIPGATNSDLNFLRDLQSIHDNYLVEEWKDEIHTLADKYNLSFNW